MDEAEHYLQEEDKEDNLEIKVVSDFKQEEVRNPICSFFHSMISS